MINVAFSSIIFPLVMEITLWFIDILCKFNSNKQQ